MRISSAAAVLVLAACSAEADPPTVAEGDPDDLVECALSGAAFARACAVETAQDDGRRVFVVRHPDGGFRRFVKADDGAGLEAADGAQRTVVTKREDSVEVWVGQDGYRFPTKVLGRDAN